MQILSRPRHCLSRCVASLFVSILLAMNCGAQTAQDTKTPEMDWARQLDAKYPGLLTEFGHLFEKLQHEVQFPGPRAESRLLQLLPEATMSYAAIPNYGGAASQVLAAFRQELKESSVLREWWKQGQVAAVGPKIEDSLDKFSQLSQYLGDEISVSGTMEGREPNLLIVAEIRKSGLNPNAYAVDHKLRWPAPAEGLLQTIIAAAGWDGNGKSAESGRCWFRRPGGFCLGIVRFKYLTATWISAQPPRDSHRPRTGQLCTVASRFPRTTMVLVEGLLMVRRGCQ